MGIVNGLINPLIPPLFAVISVLWLARNRSKILRNQVDDLWQDQVFSNALRSIQCNINSRQLLDKYLENFGQQAILLSQWVSSALGILLGIFLRIQSLPANLSKIVLPITLLLLLLFLLSSIYDVFSLRARELEQPVEKSRLRLRLSEFPNRIRESWSKFRGRNDFTPRNVAHHYKFTYARRFTRRQLQLNFCLIAAIIVSYFATGTVPSGTVPNLAANQMPPSSTMSPSSNPSGAPNYKSVTSRPSTTSVQPKAHRP